MLSFGLTSAAAMAARRPAPPPPTRRMSCDRISMFPYYGWSLAAAIQERLATLNSTYPRASDIFLRIARRCKWNYRCPVHGFAVQIKLSDGEIDVTQDKERGENPYKRGYFAQFSRGDLHHRVGDQPQAEAGGDTEGQRCSEHGNESRNRFAELAPLNVGNRLRHERADQDQRRCSCVCGNRCGQR